MRQLGTFWRAIALLVIDATLAACSTSSHHQPERSPRPPIVTPDATQARLLPDGKALAPATVAPPADEQTVAAVIGAANAIAGRPYQFGGGHWPGWRIDDGYDSSGAVSYVLHAGGFLPRPELAEELTHFDQPGPGVLITVVLCPGRAQMVVTAQMIIAGLRFDALDGPRWRTGPPSSRDDCVERHPQKY